MAFYQMNWFNTRKGEDLSKLNAFYLDVNSWREMIEYTASGKALRASFNDLYDKIVWRMPNPGPCKIDSSVQSMWLSKHPNAELPDFDLGYIRHLIGQLKPEIVIGLGDAAKEGLSRVVCQIPVKGQLFFGMHPCAENAVQSLSSLAEELKRELESYG